MYIVYVLFLLHVCPYVRHVQRWSRGKSGRLIAKRSLVKACALGLKHILLKSDEIFQLEPSQSWRHAKIPHAVCKNRRSKLWFLPNLVQNRTQKIPFKRTPLTWLPSKIPSVRLRSNWWYFLVVWTANSVNSAILQVVWCPCVSVRG